MTPNWAKFPDATHFTAKLDDSGMWADVFWRMEDGKAVRAWQIGDTSTVNVFLNPTLLPDTAERMIARPAPEAQRDAAIQDLTNLMLENPDLNQYFLARLIIDAGYSKKEAP